MKQKPQQFGKKIVARIKSRGRGWVFTPSHFEDICGRSTVSTNLQRLRESGMIRQLARGLYDYPKTHPDLGLLAPSADSIADALAGREAIRIQPSGAYAANLLGLSTQVPMKIVYLTDGASRTVQVGNRQIILKHTTPRNMTTAGRISGLVIQALRYLGQQHVDGKMIAKLNRRLDDAARRQLMKDIRYAPGWIAAVFREIGRKERGRGVNRFIKLPQPEQAPLSLVVHDRIDESEQYLRYVPFYSLEAAAGYFNNQQEVEPEGWVEVDTPLKLLFGMFVAKVEGASMEPRIPSGSYCLFQTLENMGVGDEDIVLVQHHTDQDPEHGGSYAVKRLVHDSAGRARFRSINPEFGEFPADEACSVVALLLEVLNH